MSFIKKAVKSVVKAVGKVVTGVIKAVGKVVSAVINFVASPFMGLFGVPDQGSQQEAQRQQGILVQQQGSNVDIPVVYGYRKLAGTVVYAETGSTNNKYLWVAYVFCEGLVEGLREIWIDDNLIPVDTTGKLNQGQIVDITDTKSKYAGRVRLQWYPGVFYNQPSSTGIGANSILKDAPSWKPSMNYNGMAVLFARYEWKEVKTQEDADNNPFGGGVPQVQISVLGRRVASLLAGSGQENYEYGAVGYAERYSTNPAEILLDYLRNPRYGKGLKNSEIDWPTFRRAALKCNQTVTYITGITGPILTTNYVLDTAQTIFNNVRQLLTNMRGYMPYVQGKYKLKIEDAGNETDVTSGVATIVKTFTKDNIVGDITYTGIERSAKYNQVVVSYVDPDQKWSVQQVVYPESEAERLTFVARDGGRENKAELTFPGCTNYAVAKDFARLIFNKSRYQDSCSFTGDSSCFELEPGDNVYIASNILNFGSNPLTGAIPWRIVSIQLNNDYSFDIGCVRNPDFIYPHTRVGEIDVVLPPYVPKGAEIYYPGTGRLPPVGLVPPTNGVQPGDPISNPVTNPPPTVPTDDTVTDTAIGTGTISQTTLNITSLTSGTFQVGMSITGTSVVPGTTITAFGTATGGTGTYIVSVSQTVSSTTITGRLYAADIGGGVGDPDGSINTDPINNNPIPPAPVTPLEDTIKIDRVNYTLENGQIYATLYFNQPTNALYYSTVLWYKRNVASEVVWKQVEALEKPGSGQQISYKIGPLVKAPYTVKSRVKYTTGEWSTQVATAALNATDVPSSEDPADTFETVGSGWTLDTTPRAITRDNVFATITGTPLLTSSLPRNPRQASFTIKQDINNYPINGYISGVNVYYKASPNKYWKVAKIEFASTYQEGTAYTFTLPFTLGPSGSAQLYDFCVRWRYNDSTESTKQYRNMNCRVETDPFGAYTFNIFGFTQALGQGQEAVSAYELITEDNAPPGAVSDSRNIKFSYTSIEERTSANRIKFFIATPSASDLSSLSQVRIYYKEVLATPTSIQTLTVNLINASGQRSFDLPANFDSIYEIVVVPLVDYNGTVVEATNACYFSGYVHNRQGDPDYPVDANWLNHWKVEQTTFAIAYAKIGTSGVLPAGPNRYTTFIGLSFQELLTGGLPRDPREISITMTQSSGTVGNTRLTGVKIYYKPSTFSYWYSVTHTFSGYTQGSAYTFTFPGDLGTPESTPIPFRAANYDFILRFTYDDGSESISQARRMEVPVQGGIQPTPATGSQLQQAVTSYSFQTIENAPPGTVTDPRTLTLSFSQANGMASFKESAILFYPQEPVDPLNRWAGARLYFRPVTPGFNPPFTQVDFLPITKDADGRLFFKQNIIYDKEYEYVVVPMVTYNREKVECNDAWYGRGLIHDRVDSTGRYPNWWSLLNFELIDTDVALNRIKTSFPQVDPTVQVVNWFRFQNSSDPTAPAQFYYQLQFYKAHISNYVSLDIYRRTKTNPGSGYAQYYGTGRWEKLTITDATHAPNGAGVVTVNLRPPINHTEYNSASTATPSGTGSNTLLSSLYGTNKPLSPGEVLDDILLVVNQSSGASSRALLLPKINKLALTGKIDGLAATKPQTVTVADYNTYAATWQRNLTESRSSISSTLLVSPRSRTPGIVFVTVVPTLI
jgi:hypothetical protein